MNKQTIYGTTQQCAVLFQSVQGGAIEKTLKHKVNIVHQKTLIHRIESNQLQMYVNNKR